MFQDRGSFVPRPVFGVPAPGRHYQPRPGIYAVILTDQLEIAVLEVRGEFFLPGGGIQPGELAEEALQREAVEECGWLLSIGSLIGEAVDYIEVKKDGPYYEIHSRFHQAELLEKLGPPLDPDHHLRWMPVEEASRHLKRKSQAWVTGLFLP